MAGLGTAGLGVEIARNWHEITVRYERFRNWIRGVDTRKSCQTLLLNRIEP
jgi:hypothetical protein